MWLPRWLKAISFATDEPLDAVAMKRKPRVSALGAGSRVRQLRLLDLAVRTNHGRVGQSGRARKVRRIGAPPVGW
jgi:hypothetical protein